MTLLAYRLRPLPGAVLTGLPVVLLVAAWFAAPRVGASGAIRLLQFSAIPLGLAAAFTVSRDIDPPEPVLAAAPLPYWRTPALRIVLWFLATTIVVGLIGQVLDARIPTPLPDAAAAEVARANLVLVAGLSFLLSIRGGSFIGGALALGGLAVCAIGQRVWVDWPLRVLDTVGAARWEETRAWLIVVGATFVLGGLFYLRNRS